MSIFSTLKYWFKTYAPKPIVNAWYSQQERKRFLSLHNDVLNYLREKANDNALNEEQLKILKYLESNFITPIPYDFSNAYRHIPIKVYNDKGRKLKYVLLDDKRLYFNSSMTNYDIEKAYRALYIEQHSESPHQYLTNDFSVHKGSVFIDVGAAEGYLSLQVVDYAKKIYVIEADPSWRSALEATFEPWKDKVTIICKYASNKDSANEISIDSIFEKEKRIDFIKVDVEGAESQVIEGADNTIRSSQNNFQLTICTYHKQIDGDMLSATLADLGFDVTFSNGYMFFYYGQELPQPPYLRRGLIRATLKAIR